MPAGQVQREGVLHPCWLHFGGSEPIWADPRPLLAGCDEGVSRRSSASGNKVITVACVFFSRGFFNHGGCRRFWMRVGDCYKLCSVFKKSQKKSKKSINLPVLGSNMNPPAPCLLINYLFQQTSSKSNSFNCEHLLKSLTALPEV